MKIFYMLYSINQLVPVLLNLMTFCIFPIQVGFSHSNILRTIIQHACLRFPALLSHNIISSPSRRISKSSSVTEEFIKQHKKVYVIFGGDTSERQVSLMSGTNVWLNLRASDDVSFRVYQINESYILNVSTVTQGHIPFSF